MASEEMRPDIAAAWAAMPSRGGSRKKPVRKLPEYLNGGETVLRLTGGRVAQANGLVVATDRRVMFISDSVGKRTFEDFPYDRITTVTSASGFAMGKLVITTAGASRVIGNVPKQEVDTFGAVVRERVEAVTRERYGQAPLGGPSSFGPPPSRQTPPAWPAGGGRHAQPATPPGPAMPGIAQELRELAELRDRGVLTPEEFEAQKQRLLAR